MRPVLVFLVSLLGHIGLVAAGLLYFPDSVRQYTTSQIVPLELVTEIQEVTNLPEEEIEETPVEEEVPEPEAPPPPEEPEIDLRAAPETRPEAEAAPEPEAEAVSDEDTPAQPETREREVASNSASSFDDMLRDLASTVEAERAPSSSRSRTAARSEFEAIGVTLADSIRSQAQRCYRSSLDAPNPEQLVVVVRVRLNRDGSLDGRPDILNNSTIDNSDNRYWRVARDRAMAAIIDCAPYRLPAEHFSIWRRIDVTFRSEA